jgi:signal transduction histidine kinase
VSESLRLLALLAPVTVATVLSSVAARTLVRRAPLSYTLVAIAVVASSVTVVDMVLLNHFMLLNPNHWAEITLVALYSLTAAVAAALIVGRTTDDAIRRLATTAQSLGNNDLEVRTGSLNASPELQLLGATLDRAAERLEFAIETERRIEGQRRDLMTSISHDLRTPLASIRATVEAINDGVVDDPQTVRRYAAEMLRSISALVEASVRRGDPPRGRSLRPRCGAARRARGGGRPGRGRRHLLAQADTRRAVADRQRGQVHAPRRAGAGVRGRRSG